MNKEQKRAFWRHTGMSSSADEILEAMLSMQDEQQRQVLCRFFKTGKGEYGEGDKFFGLKVPQTRQIANWVGDDITLDEIRKLIYSEWHEARLCGLLLLARKVSATLPKARRSGNAAERQRLVLFYLKHAKQANNWDLVDLSCGSILGRWLLHPLPDGRMPDRSILDRLAESENLWEQRISIVATLPLIKSGQYADTLRISDKLLMHKHDLMHKAVGWMLREIGKKDIEILRSYLTAHVHDMSRTTLRYSIERMDTTERRYWMDL